MGNSSSGLAIVALLIAIGGVGLGIYSVIILPDIIVEEASGTIDDHTHDNDHNHDNETIIEHTHDTDHTHTSEIIQMWSVEQPSAYYTSLSFNDIPDMDVTITVNAGESVYIFFNGYFTAGVGWFIGGVRLRIDNTVIDGSMREFNIESSFGTFMAYSLTTHILLDSLAAGEYEIEVQASGAAEVGSDRVEDGLMIIYTYK